LVGADCKILKNPNYGNGMEELRLEYRASNNTTLSAHQKMK
jgi:hypothetical protein